MNVRVENSAILALLAGLLGAGCELTPTEDLLSISFGTGASAPPIEVDTLCGNGGCDQAAEIEAVLAYDDDGTVEDDAELEVLQYRVDFEMGGVTETVPFYAGE